ncbi:CpaF family protein [Caulobacter segnis]|uniref:CpaF family protein n=1 Tax=Caulobacter segnis TaxID=88688 RepID=UPI00240F3CBF|nr:CpaF family protein [Caulobacter segnis]MDG2520728.1 CpaF family protein [Caulobacter segnis]
MNAQADIARTDDLVLTDLYQDAKFAIFERLLEQLETKSIVGGARSASVRAEIEEAIHRHSARAGMALNSVERIRLADDLHNEVAGLGPLEPLLRDPSVDDVICNGPLRIFVEKGGRLHRAAARFRDTAHMMTIIQRIVGAVGRRVDESTPYVDARLQDGSRVNVVVPPIALDGPMLSIRKVRAQPLTAQEMVRSGSMSQEMLDFLERAVRARLNILISGGTGSGKTTLLNMLSGYIGDHERVITIEDAAELKLQRDDVVRLETRPPNVDGTREVSPRDLLRNALRMRPDRIVLGEVRGAEAVEMLQAMSTGHDGSMATLHANNDRDAFARLEMLLSFGGLGGDPRALRRYVASSIQLVVQIQRSFDGARRITSISEVTGVEGEVYSLNQLFLFDEAAGPKGEHRTLSRRPHFAQRLSRAEVAPAWSRP